MKLATLSRGLRKWRRSAQTESPKRCRRSRRHRRRCQVVYTQQTGDKTPIPGCFGCFETINASHGTVADNAPYGQIIYGDSLIMMTELRSDSGARTQRLTASS